MTNETPEGFHPLGFTGQMIFSEEKRPAPEGYLDCETASAKGHIFYKKEKINESL